MRVFLKTVLVIFLIIISTNYIHPQIITWERIFEFDNYNSFIRIQNTSDSGYIVIGNITYNNINKIFVCKLNQYGDTVWTKVLFQENQFIYSGIWIEPTCDNGFILISRSNEFFNDDILVIKLDSNGNIKLKNYIGGSPDEVGKCIKNTTDSGYVILGYSNYSTLSRDLIIIKLDKSAKLQWERTYNSGFFDYPSEVEVTKRGYSIVSSYDSLSLFKVRLLFLNEKGDSIKCTFNSNNSKSLIANSLQVTSGNEYIIGGYSIEYNNYVSSYLLKTDSSGNRVFEKFYNQLGYEECHSVREFPNKGYVLCGRADTAFVGGNVKAYFRIVDYSGNILNEKYFSPGNNTNRFNSVEVTSDKGIIFGGFAGMTEWGPFGYALKTDSLGNIKVNISNSIFQSNLDFELFQNYPNPFNSSTRIKYKTQYKGKLFFNVYDLTGKLIFKKSIGEIDAGEHEMIFNSDYLKLSSGIYFYQMVLSNSNQFNVTKSKKFVLIK